MHFFKKGLWKWKGKVLIQTNAISKRKKIEIPDCNQMVHILYFCENLKRNQMSDKLLLHHTHNKGFFITSVHFDRISQTERWRFFLPFDSICIWCQSWPHHHSCVILWNFVVQMVCFDSLHKRSLERWEKLKPKTLNFAYHKFIQAREGVRQEVKWLQLAGLRPDARCCNCYKDKGRGKILQLLKW